MASMAVLVSRRGASLLPSLPCLAARLSVSPARVSSTSPSRSLSQIPSRGPLTPTLPCLTSRICFIPPKAASVMPPMPRSPTSRRGSVITALVSGIPTKPCLISSRVPLLRYPSSVLPPRLSARALSVPARGFSSGARSDEEGDIEEVTRDRRRKKMWNPIVTESGEEIKEQLHFSGLEALLDPNTHVAGDIVGMPLDVLVAALHQENGRDLCVINVPPELNYVDYFVVVTGSSTRHLRAMAEYTHSLYKYLKATEYEHIRIEGHSTNDWMCIDFGNIVVHFMLEEVRERLELEKLWTLREHDDQLSSIPCETIPLEFVGEPTEFFEQKVVTKDTTPHTPLG